MLNPEGTRNFQPKSIGFDDFESVSIHQEVFKLMLSTCFKYCWIFQPRNGMIGMIGMMIPNWRASWAYMAIGQYLLIPFLVGWTSIYQLCWCSPGVQGLDTLPYLSVGASTTSLELILTHLHWTTFSGGQKFGTFRPHFEVKRKACVSSCCRKSVLPLGMADVKLLGWSTLWLTNIAMENPHL